MKRLPAATAAAAAVTALVLGVSAATLAQAPASAVQPPAGAGEPPAAGVPESTPLRQTVLAGDTLYVSGQLDLDPSGKPGKDATESAKLALDRVKKAVEDAGFTMNDLVLVQVFAKDLKNFEAFNKVYRTYFTGPMPARAFIGAGNLLRGGRFEVLGIAVKGHK
jgi:2-iminobutanoate/2-iminopropanoate deaminase